jgi:hypothetical protein
MSRTFSNRSGWRNVCPEKNLEMETNAPAPAKMETRNAKDARELSTPPCQEQAPELPMLGERQPSLQVDRISK